LAAPAIAILASVSRFGEEAEVFRTYLGKDYKPKATAGCWMLMETGDLYPSHNSLTPTAN